MYIVFAVYPHHSRLPIQTPTESQHPIPAGQHQVLHDVARNLRVDESGSQPNQGLQMQDTPSSALGRACPVQGPFEIQAPPSHHWFTRRGQPSCRARRAIRSSSLGPDSLQPPTTNTAETPRVWLTSPAEPARKGLCQSAASLWTARGGIAKGWDTSWPWPRPVFSGGWTRSRSGIGSRWPIVSVARLSETGFGTDLSSQPCDLQRLVHARSRPRPWSRQFRGLDQSLGIPASRTVGPEWLTTTSVGGA